jgi:photosystem II stability/assembly factor-like uncharacterized protein/PKD repeat protein
MHKFHLLVMLLFAVSFSYAQNSSPTERNQSSDYPEWIDMMQDPNANFFDIQQAFEDYYAQRERSKGDGWKPFKRWEWQMLQRIDADGNMPAATEVMDQYQLFMSQYASNSKSTAGNWIELGPSNMPINATGQPNGLGRVNGIGFHPTNANIFYIAAPSGGVWKTIDGGSSWAPLTDTLPTLGASCIIVHPSSTNTIYVGTGDRDAGDAPGIGVIKSTDGGATWSIINSGMGNKTVGDMLMHPSNSNIMIAATSGGIYRTTNGGSTWTKTSGSSSHFKDLEFKPNDPNTVYAAAGSSFYKSTDNGVTWTSVSSGLPSTGRFVIGVSAASANTVYVLAGGSNGLIGCYRSTNSATSFSTQSTSPNILGYSSTGSDNKSQAWYDLAIAVDPANANTIYVGGVNIWKSTNGGSNWALNAHWVGSGGVPAVHADIHSLDFSPVNSRLYCGNDGGLHYTTNGGTSWPEISSGLGIAQIYKIGQSATDKNKIINGYQDNGTAYYDNGTWTTAIGGDGMECIVDYTNANYMYGALYYGDIRRYDGTNINQIAGDQVNGITEEGGWVTPYILDMTNSNTMVVGYKNLWRSTNVKAVSASAVSWTKLTNNLGGSNSYNIRAIEQSEANSSILYFSRWDDKLFRSDNFSNSSPTFTDISSSLPNTNYTPSDIEAHPSNANIVYITLYQDVYKSTDKGLTWTNISGNLPNITLNCIVIDTASSNEALYVGTDAGIYYKDNTLSNWVPFMDGLPVAAKVTELEIYYHSNQALSAISAATYGRGLWQSDLYSSGLATPLTDFGWSDDIICTGDTISFTDSTIFNPTSWAWSFTPSSVSYANGTNANSQNPVVVFGTAGYYTVSLTTTNANGSDTKTVTDLIKAGGYKPPFLESWESNSPSISQWGVGNSDGATTWALASVSGNGSSTQAVFMNNYNYSTTGELDNLFSPIINLKGLASASLKYKHAYTRYTGYPTDSLIIYASNNCGATWTQLVAYGEDGTGNFATAPDTTYSSSSNFSPSSASDWCLSGVGASCDSIDLSAYVGDDNVRLVFQNYNNYSNNLYLDDIEIVGSVGNTLIANYTLTSTTACTGTQITFTNTSLNATSYVWKKDGISIGTTTNLNYTFNTAGSYEIILVASNGTSLDSISQMITINATPGQASPITGPASTCNNNNSTYQTAGATDATSYVWSLSPSNAGTISGTGLSATVVWDPTFTGTGSVNVYGVNSCGNGLSPSAKNTSVTAGPGNATTPTGNTTVCQGTQTSTYTTTNLPGNPGFAWSISPANAGTISGGSIYGSVNWDPTFTGSATISVQATNSCGSGTSSPTLSVTVLPLPTSISTPTGPSNLCIDAANTTYSVSAVPNASNYNWHLSPVAAGTISGTTNNAIVDWDQNFVGNAYIKVDAITTCGSTPQSNNHTTTIHDNPPTPVITKSNDTLFSSSQTGNQWYGPNGVIVGANNAYYVPTSNGNHYVEVTTTHGCTSQSTTFNMTGVGITDLSLENDIKIYPNPAHDFITIEYYGDEAIKLSLRNVLGQELNSFELDKTNTIDLSKISAGVYYIVLENKLQPNIVSTKKILVY